MSATQSNDTDNLVVLDTTTQLQNIRTLRYGDKFATKSCCMCIANNPTR
jgi:hypothetical protein